MKEEDVVFYVREKVIIKYILDIIKERKEWFLLIWEQKNFHHLTFFEFSVPEIRDLTHLYKKIVFDNLVLQMKK